MKRLLMKKKQTKITITEGTHARTLTPITTTGGIISIQGTEYKARVAKPGKTIDEHMFVEIIEIENGTAIVEPFWNEYLK